MFVPSDQLKIIRYAIRANSRPNPTPVPDGQIDFIANKTYKSAVVIRRPAGRIRPDQLVRIQVLIIF
jgi:hypothetical protein